MRAFETVRYDKDEEIGVITLDRPRVINAMNMKMRDELYEIFSAVVDDEEVKGILLAGAGYSGFCAGADLTEFGTSPSQAIARYVRWERDLWGLILRLNKPIVASLHGVCFGSGLEIACLCDFRIATDSTVFRMPEVGLGLVPAAGGTQMLPRLIGPGAALELLLSGQEIDATGALEMGLVTRVVPEAHLDQKARDLLKQIVNNPGITIRYLKRSINEGMDLSLDQGLDLESRLAVSMALERRR